jgi:Spy/CpxP family protein refolding chaperone
MSGRATNLICVVVVLLAAGAAAAQPLVLPPGKWWERPAVAGQLGLAPEQVAKLSATTYTHLRSMVDLKAAVDKANLDLAAAAEDEPFDTAKVRAAFGAVQQARLKLESQRFEMLLKIRELLTPDQWRKLQAVARERREDGQAAPGAVQRRNQQRRGNN